MIEILILIGFCATTTALARKRGKAPWFWVVAMIAAYLLPVFIAAVPLGLGPGPAMIVGIIACFVFYAVLFFTLGGRRRSSDTWQCPECHLFNDPDAIVCGCGYELPKG